MDISWLTGRHGLKEGFPKCGLQTSSIKITWQLARNWGWGGMGAKWVNGNGSFSYGKTKSQR